MKLFTAAISVLASVLLTTAAGASEDKIGVVSQHPTAAPGGQEFAFSADFDGPARIWASALDGSRLRRLSSDQVAAAAHTEPAWSPDGERIAYVSAVSGFRDIWVMQANGWYPVRLTANGANNSHPVWSPDGRRIAFVSDKDGTSDAWIMNADGTRPEKLVNSSAQENAPTFSPTGDQIAFSSTDADKANLMAVAVNGQGARAITTGNFRDWEPAWGPRGILFSSDRDGSGRWKIWLVQPDGSKSRQLGNVAGHDPTWLPDGRVLFTNESMPSKAISAISVFDPESGSTRVVVDVQGYFTPIDIRPGKSINQLNPSSPGRVRVAILSTRSLDATKGIDKSSITFGRTGAESSLADCSEVQDVNNDGLTDLVCRFTLRYAGFRMGDTAGVLRFTDKRGVPYEGRDAIVTVSDAVADD